MARFELVRTAEANEIAQKKPASSLGGANEAGWGDEISDH
jgi:hypothetical protein